MFPKLGRGNLSSGQDRALQSGGRSAEEETLRIRDAHRRQGLVGFPGFHVFGHDRDFQDIRQGLDRPDDGLVKGFRCNVADKGALDFDHVNRKTLEVVERRSARSEVVQRKAESPFPQGGHRVTCGREVRNDIVLGEFENDA